jgi:hypothetical protein
LHPLFLHQACHIIGFVNFFEQNGSLVSDHANFFEQNGSRVCELQLASIQWLSTAKNVNMMTV